MGTPMDKRNARVRKKVQEYFEQCDREDKRYTLAGLMVALGPDGKNWEEMRRDRYLGPDLELAVARIQDALEQRGDAMALLLRREMGNTAAGVTPTRVMFETEGDLEEYGG